jgi:hypothetical protein
MDQLRIVGETPMNEIMIIVTCRVDSDEASFTEEMATAAATQAVKNALKQIEGEGFQHEYADHASIAITAVETDRGEVEEVETTECSLCHNDVPTKSIHLDREQHEICDDCWDERMR